MRVLFVQQQQDDPPGLVGERLAELGARIEVVDPRRPMPRAREFDLVVPLGSADSAADDTLPYLAAEWRLLDEAVRAKVPVFGICFGAQLLCRVLGGSVAPAPGGPEIGWLRVDSDPGGPVQAGPWAVWHHDVMHLPAAATEVARTPVGPHAFTSGPHLGVQFHPEATVSVVATWAGAHQSMRRDTAELLRQMEADQAGARQRAAILIDSLLAHSGVVVR